MNYRETRFCENLNITRFETMTKGRVYATVSESNQVKFISYYDNQNKRVKTIDIDHFHKSIKPHTHHGYLHNENDGPKGATKLTVKEQKMVENVIEKWYNRNGK